MVTRLGKYSYSSLETYNGCPKKFQFAYIDKIAREPKKNAPTIMGGIAHRALEKIYTLAADGVLYPKEDMVQFYQDEWNNIAIDSIEVSSQYHTVDDYIKVGQKILEEYYDKFLPFNQDKLLGTEINLYFNLPESDFQFNCRIDRLSKRDDGVIEIVDYKTGTYLAKAKDKSYHFQMGLYLLAVRENYPDFKEIELVQYFLRHGEAVRYAMREDEEESLIEEFKQSINETIDATKRNDFPTKESSFCAFCDYAGMCPAKIHKLMLEDEEKSTIGDISAEKLKELANSYVEKDRDQKILKEEVEDLKAQLIEITRQHDMTTFESDFGKVSVSLKNDYKFITKTEDAKAVAALNFLCRESGLDEYFILDSRALMKDGIKKLRVDKDLVEKLEEFIVPHETKRVSFRKKSSKDNDDPKIIR